MYVLAALTASKSALCIHGFSVILGVTAISFLNSINIDICNDEVWLNII
jgi:hypothetical protein